MAMLFLGNRVIFPKAYDRLDRGTMSQKSSKRYMIST